MDLSQFLFPITGLVTNDIEVSVYVIIKSFYVNNCCQHASMKNERVKPQFYFSSSLFRFSPLSL
jgi:hypothetical protein